MGGARDGNKQTSSAPPRLQRVSTSYYVLAINLLYIQASHPLHGWRFINKYTHRSNGGIPMFAEERLKERSEKVVVVCIISSVHLLKIATSKVTECSSKS